MDGVRQRQHTGGQRVRNEPYYDYDKPKVSIKPRFETKIGTQHLLFVLTFLLSVSLTVIVLEKILPEPQLISLENLYPEKFVAERARDHILNLTSVGPRVAGSHENEVLAVNFLTSTINKIIENASKSHKILFDVTRNSGAFPLTFLDGMTNVYKNVQNIIVRLGPREESKHSLLLNCHFDSFINSPGGSDDAASCAVMLEVLRVISQSTKYLKHNIIFLFNGAEENILQASHGFITQHKWAKEVRAFINMEACGAGGRELLFQAGPGNPWILEVYSTSVPYPYASSLAQEIFESGIVPGETDFRIFRDFGNVSGLDFAWSKNGYVYHTKYDSIEQIPLGSLQRTGDNILALCLGILSAHYLSDEIIDNKDESLVFFDFLGAFVLRWSETTAKIINIAGVFIGVYSVYLNMISESRNLSKPRYIKHLSICIMTVICSWVITMVSITTIALILTKLGKVMSWYARPAWLFFLYICPTVAISMTFFLSMSARQRKTIESSWTLYHLFFDAYSVIWIAILLSCVILNIRSGFIPLHWVLFSSIGNIIRHSLFAKCKDWKWLCYHLMVLSLPYVQSFYLCIGALYLFIPVMGRAGASRNSEVIIASMVSLMFCFLLSFTLQIVVLVKNAGRVISVLLSIFLISIAVLILTPLGFPYSGDPNSPAAQRFMIVHTQRDFYNLKGDLRQSNSGYWIVNSDMNSPHSVENFVPEVGAALPSTEDCQQELYCGFPYLMPVTTFLGKTSWIPGPAPLIAIPTKLELIGKSIKENQISYSFNVTGPDHISIMISPQKDLHLHKWSIVDGEPLKGPTWNERETYFIYYSCVKDCEPYNFSIDLHAPTNYVGPSLTVTLSGHFLHGENQSSPRFKQFLAQFPSWTVITPWTASVTSWEF